MKAIGYKNVDLTGGFWGARQTLNSRVTMQAVYDRFNETGRVGAFACRWRPDDPTLPKPHVFWDSDMAKWIEAAAYILAKEDRPDLVEKVESMIDDMERNQWEDGYINSHYTVVEPEKRFTERNNHELYCCGHLIEAAVAYYEATGRDRFLKMMCRYADLVDRVFRVENSAAFCTPGHEEIELALFKLWRVTGNEKYKTLAEHFLEARGNNDKDPLLLDWTTRAYQHDKKIREQVTALGHSVRACYLYSGMADMALAEGDEALADACRKLHEDIVTRKMYVTGGIGSTHIGEAFTIPYDLPSDRAYTETCAGIALLFFSHRMEQIELDSVYADTIERTLYNGILSGLSLDGRAFFYENPLEINLRDRKRSTSTTSEERMPITQRLEVFGCSCCPPNVNRLLASLGEYVYGTDADTKTLIIHQYMQSRAAEGGMSVEVVTDYPRTGKVLIRTSGVKTLKFRIPGWCASPSIGASYRVERGYAVIEDPAAEIEADFPIVPRAIFGNPQIRDTAGRVAIGYGPIVMCVEARDNGGVEPYRLRVDLPLDPAKITVGYSETYGAPVLTLPGRVILPSGDLYSTVAPAAAPCEIRMIPYFAFANRGEDDMAVWLR